MKKDRTGADAAVRAFEKSDISQILITIGGMLIYAIALIAMMLFNNSAFKRNLTEKRNLKQAEKLSKEEV